MPSPLGLSFPIVSEMKVVASEHRDSRREASLLTTRGLSSNSQRWSPAQPRLFGQIYAKLEKERKRTLGSFRIIEFPTSADTPDNSLLPLAKWDSPPPCLVLGKSSRLQKNSSEGRGGQK